MKKLVTALIIVLPLIFLIALLATTSIVTLSATIPVTSLKILNRGDNGVFTFDMADYASPLYENDLGIEILPYQASNKNYTLSITDLDGNNSNLVTKEDDGHFELNDIGQAKLTYTSKDGSYSDSVIFNITTTNIIDYKPILLNSIGEEVQLLNGTTTDYIANVSPGMYSFSSLNYPNNISNVELNFSSESEAIDVQNITGITSIFFSGKTIITMMVETAKGLEEKTIELNVTKPTVNTINGSSAYQVSAPLKSTSYSFFLETADPSLNSDNIILMGSDIDGYTVEKLSNISDSAYKISVTLFDPYLETTTKSYNLSVGTDNISIQVDYSDYEFNVFSSLNTSGDGDIIAYLNSVTKLTIQEIPFDQTIVYSYRMENTSIANVINSNDNDVSIKGLDFGETTLFITWQKYDGDLVVNDGEFERKIIVTENYSSILFSENASTYGLGNLAIAKYSYDNNEKVQNDNLLNFIAFKGKDKLQPEYKDILFSSSDTNVAKVVSNEDGVKLDIFKTGTIILKAQAKYNSSLVSSLVVTVVDGIECSTYGDLLKASSDKEEIVLKNDIYLGEKLLDQSDEYKKNKLLSETKEIKTTWDWTYYKNVGEEHPSVRYALEFTNSVYGNGYSISGEYITNMLDSTDKLYDYAVFRGPLDFVSTSKDGTKVAAVKGQDNIVFLVREDNVSLDNVILKGCDDESIYEDGSLNLSLLNYVGTTLEIMSDAKVLNSRVMNGRTVTRIFGRYGVDSTIDVENEKINVSIDNCIMQNAREFIIKIGTNRYKLDKDEASPYLTKRTGASYTQCNSSNCDSLIDDEYFTSNYLLTDVTLKDSTLKTSGLFTIGLESHFAGLMLAGQDNTFKLDGWTNLAATSYPAVLHLVGNVVLADWKELDLIDSSTLIETSGSNSSLSFLNLNINEMLKAVKQYGKEQYDDIIDNRNGTNYVHGGIALYGGGKNYHMIDMSNYTFEPLTQYNVNLSILSNSSDDTIKAQGNYLPLAAGTNDFRFFMFSSSSKFNIDTQNSL